MAYVGTTAHLGRLERARLACLAERELRLASDAFLCSLARQAGLTAFCLVGTAATGDALETTTLLFLESAVPVPDALIKAITERAGALLNTWCVLVDARSVRSGEMPTFEIPALGRAVAPSSGAQEQLSLDLGPGGRRQGAT